jgi:hypothetical protein
VADELSIEQKRAIAIAKARLRLQQQTHQPGPAAPPSIADPMKDFSLFAGGPVQAFGRYAARTASEGIEKSAYDAGGAVTDVTGSPVAGGVTNAAINAIPAAIGGVGGGLVQPITRNLPGVGSRALMQSAIKPSSKDLASGDAAKAIEAFLREGKNATPSGVSQFRREVGALSQAVDEIIKGSQGTVGRQHISPEMVEQLKVFRKQVNPEADVAAVLKSWNEFKRNNRGAIPVQEAQELKKGTYKILADKYAHLGTVGDEAGTQSQMALARGLRKGIEAAEPAVIPHNKRMTDLINAIEIAERRAGIAGNRDLAGIAWLAENPLASGGMLADRSPLIKSLLARYMHSGTPGTGALGGAIYSRDSERDKARSRETK